MFAMKSDLELTVVIRRRESDSIVEEQVAIVCADDEIRQRAAGLLFFDRAEHGEHFSIAGCYHEILPPLAARLRPPRAGYHCIYEPRPGGRVLTTRPEARTAPERTRHLRSSRTPSRSGFP